MDLKKWAFSILFIAAGLFAAYLALWTGWIAALLAFGSLFRLKASGGPAGFWVGGVDLPGSASFFLSAFKRRYRYMRFVKKGGNLHPNRLEKELRFSLTQSRRQLPRLRGA
jgi:hypothetical protein